MIVPSTSSAAFADCERGEFVEVARLLRRVADRLDGSESSGSIVDVNGNRCGRFGWR